jgi:ribosomal subunit interface protein
MAVQPRREGVIGSMQLTVTGKQIDVGDALRRHVEASLTSILAKYFGTAIEAHVVLAREAHLTRAEISVHIGRGIEVNAHAAAQEIYAALDAASDRVAKRLRRYKRRLRDYHAKARERVTAGERAIDYVLAPVVEEADDEEVDGAFGSAPAVIAEMSMELPHLTVGEAVMRMDLADATVLLFRNRSHGELNLVYRRADGNIGWIDPELDPTRQTRRRAS